MSRPNILYIHSHDTGRYIQPYGHAVATPGLQRLAEQGVLFRQSFCVSPTCSPSRASLLTGCYPHENGMTGLAHRGWDLNDYQQHVIHTLRKEGYTSALAGVQHIAASTTDKKAWQVIGYDQYLEGEAHEQASTFLDNCPKDPFFLSVGFFETHREFPALSESPDDPRYCMPPAPLPDTPQIRQDMTRFKASARTLDQKMSVVFDALDRNGLADNTLVICTTDHGIAFPRMKCNLHDSGLGVMLIMRGPGGFTGGEVIDSMTSHLDIFPTICDVLDIEPPAWLRGSSLLPLIRKEVDEVHGELFFEVNYHAAYNPMRAVRTNRWKYIKHFDARSKPVLPNCDDSESKSDWLEYGWQEKIVPEESLFDLVFDPNETNNLADEAGSQTILQEMRDRLKRWMQETSDPLLNGNLPAPDGAVVNDSNGLSPTEKPQPHQRPAITIRPATQDDIDRLLSIHRAALKAYIEATWGWDDDWQADYFREHFDASIRHVICYEGDSIGFLDVIAQPDAIILQNIEIDPDYHGRGIGTELISRVIIDADSNGIPVRLQVLKVNSRARDLYERLGFVLTGHTDTHCQMARPCTG